jgi:hypothetical protein
MRRGTVVAGLILASAAAWAQQTPYDVENFPGSNRANWHPQNGTLTEDATSGLSSPTSADETIRFRAGRGGGAGLYESVSDKCELDVTVYPEPAVGKYVGERIVHAGACSELL